jgi:uncharacterized protein
MASAESHDLVRVELAYSAQAREVILLPLQVPAQSSVLQALRLSRLLERFPEIDLASVTVGIWGRRVPLSHLLREGDRIEIYRGLQVDPKEARRLRYRAQGDRGRVRRKKPEVQSKAQPEVLPETKPEAA